MGLHVVVIPELLRREPGGLLPSKQSHTTSSGHGQCYETLHTWGGLDLPEKGHEGYPQYGHPDEEDDDDVDPPGPGLLDRTAGGSVPSLERTSPFINHQHWSEFYLIGEVTKDHLGEKGHEDGGHDGGGDVLPAEAEEQPRPGACHQLNVLGEPLEAVAVSHAETLKQRDHQQRDGAAEVVVDGEGVVPGVVAEHQ